MPQFGPGNAGRPRGSVNRLTAVTREAFLFAFKKVGGKRALAEWAAANPGDFFPLVARLIPRQLEIEGELSLPVVQLTDLTGRKTTATEIAADVFQQVR